MDDLRAAVSSLRTAGLDLVHEFDPAQVGYDEPRGLLIGNTRALWAPFQAALAADAAIDGELARAADPLDRYVERHVRAAFGAARISFAHAIPIVPLAPIAVQTGLAALAPNHFLVHPTYGPWFALRACVLLDGPRPPTKLPIAQPCHCTSACLQPMVGTGDSLPARWTAVRDACELRAYRYSDEQLAFHNAGALRTMRR